MKIQRSYRGYRSRKFFNVKKNVKATRAEILKRIIIDKMNQLSTHSEKVQALEQMLVKERDEVETQQKKVDDLADTMNKD